MEESDENAQALELYWKTAYYEPLVKIRKQKNLDGNWFDVMVSVFCGELQNMLAESPRHAAMYNLYLGDLHSRTNLDSEGVRLVEAIKSLKDPLHDRQLSSLLLILSLSTRLAVEGGNEDAFIGCVTLLCSCYLSLIDKVVITQPEEVHDDDEDAFIGCVTLLCSCYLSLIDKVVITQPEEVHDDDEVIRIRRRKVRSDSDREDDSRSRDSSSSEEESEEEETKLPIQEQEAWGWILAAICEWLFYISPQLHSLKNRKKTPIPAALLNVFHSLVDKLIHQLNQCAKAMRTVEDADEEIRWLLYGASVEDNVRAVRQAAHWAFKLCAVDTAPIEFAGYFRRRGPTAETVELQRKMAQLHTETVRKEVRALAFLTACCRIY
ncbi:hypothetical protein OESDEN_11845 [Oesophagostomum dentatum]|uniref:EST1-like DNA-binding domain-containing protein n=1 Tax=Oesophagostomum dentatum TaxID=61180 RepID=A0A0B1SXW6_OESDE|nr:hypothetical protein OESDEN_11845 [Oesophagostomum dentatum]